MIANLAGQSIGEQISANDGTPFVGTVNVWVTGDDGTQLIGSVAGGLCLSEGNGYYNYVVGLADVAFTKHIAFTFVGVGAVTKTVQVGLPATLLRSTAGQITGCQMTTLADGTDFTGVVTVHVTGDSGPQTLGATSLGICTLKGHGYYQYLPALGETTFLNVAFTYTGPGAINKGIEIATITAAQAQGFQTATSMGSVAVSTIISDAFMELNVFGASQSQDPGDMAFGLGKLNRVFDNLNAMRQGVYQQKFIQFTLTPALSPHTIGPTGVWVETQRPVTIDGGDLAVGSGVTQPIDFDHDWAWYQNISLQSQTSGYPTDAYYEPAWPNGKIYFWPVPSSARVVTLSVRLTLAQVTLVDTFWMPPGYRDAITLTLAESLMSAYPRTGRDDGKLSRAALLARERVYANNLIIPALITVDSGMPGGQGGLMNWRTRQVMP